MFERRSLCDCSRYFTIAITFAAIYYGLSPHDNTLLSLPTLGHAFVASLQIQSTIGFAAPVDGHWARKPGLIVAITLHGITTVLFNIFLLGTLFARMSSAKNRALSVRISPMAVLRPTESSPYPCIEFRVGEIRKHQLMNLKVSAFLFSHRGEKLFHREKLDLTPSDGIFLAVPTELRHFISETSPLWKLFKQDLIGVSNFDCLVCGDSFDSRSNLMKHATFMADVAGDMRHRETVNSLNNLSMPSYQTVLNAIQSSSQYWEIALLVEGTEPVTGSPIQVRQSFLAEDLVAGRSFAKCWWVEIGDNGSKKIVVDFAMFNALNSDEEFINP